MSTRPSRATRYAVIDPHLRFWLAFLGPHLPEIERGRGDLTVDRIRTGWGRAIEPVVREALHRLPDRLPPETVAIGGYWTRSHEPEVDLVGADREPVAKKLTSVGPIKWQENRPFDVRDLGRLTTHRDRTSCSPHTRGNRRRPCGDHGSGRACPVCR